MWGDINRLSQVRGCQTDPLSVSAPFTQHLEAINRPEDIFSVPCESGLALVYVCHFYFIIRKSFLGGGGGGVVCCEYALKQHSQNQTQLETCTSTNTNRLNYTQSQDILFESQSDFTIQVYFELQYAANSWKWKSVYVYAIERQIIRESVLCLCWHGSRH